MTEQISFIDLKRQQQKIRSELDCAIKNVLDHGKYIMGPEVSIFEKDIRDFCNSKYAITCANGTDALTMVLMAWGIGPGDAVFVPNFTYVATAEAPAQLGATPFFVDVNEDTFNMSFESFKSSISDAIKLGLNPKVVIPVDLFGRPSNFEEINQIARSKNIKVLIDAAQSFGGNYKGKCVGSMGDATTTSFFPAKPLGCYGDGGAVFTQNKSLSELLNSIRFHGKGDEKYDNVRVGINSRLDTLQAAILIEKLKIFRQELELRQKVADFYNSELSGIFNVPRIDNDFKSSWAQYTLIVENRDELQKKLNKNGIPSVVYYPKSLSQQEGYKDYPCSSSGLKISEELANKVLSLPMHPYIELNELEKVVKTLKQT